MLKCEDQPAAEKMINNNYNDDSNGSGDDDSGSNDEDDEKERNAKEAHIVHTAFTVATKTV